MPAISAERINFLTAVSDSLIYGQNAGARASATIGSGANGTIQLVAKAPGTAGNSWTVAVTVPAGTASLAVTVVGTAISVALAVSSGVPVTNSNTAKLIAAAINNSSAGTSVKASFTGTGASSISAAQTTTAFAGGTAIDTNRATVGVNYLRAQDMATVLEFFKEALGNSSVVTATGGSTTTAVVSALVSGAYVGAKVTFASNTTTAALQGVTAYVKSNNTTTLTFTSALPAACASTDTFTIEQTFLDAAISELRSGRNRGDAPAGNPFGLSRTVLNALQKICEQAAGSTLTAKTIATLTTGSGSTTTSVVNSTSDMRIDAFKGMTLTVSGASRKILGNTESTFVLTSALGSAPSASTSFTVTIPAVDSDNDPTFAYAGGQPHNYKLANFIASAQAVVEAFVSAA